jgi:AmiR/NasT family two-component response regulator
MDEQRDAEMQGLRDEVQRLLAAALKSNVDLTEVISRMDEVHDTDLAQFKSALDTRDLIGQAKGVIMSALGCSADEAFALIVKQSQHENRKVHEIATEIAARTLRQKDLGHHLPPKRTSPPQPD